MFFVHFAIAIFQYRLFLVENQELKQKKKTTAAGSKTRSIIGQKPCNVGQH